MLGKLKLKNFLFQVLDKLPPHIAYPIYHFIQKNLGKTTLEQKITAAENTFSDFQRLTMKAGISIVGKSVLEIGSGWLPIMPYFFKYRGKAVKIFSYDLRKHFSSPSIVALNESFSEKYDVEIPITENEFSLPPDISYFPNTNLTRCNIPPVDIVFSRFVLEHVAPEDIKKIHIKLKESLEPGSCIIHFISPSDHRAYVDNSLSLQDFLKFSEEEWNSKQTKFDYHNRLRLPEYLEIFRSLGLEVIVLEYDVPSKESNSYKKFKALDLHQDYDSFSEEELTAGSINILLKV